MGVVCLGADGRGVGILRRVGERGGAREGGRRAGAEGKANGKGLGGFYDAQANEGAQGTEERPNGAVAPDG